VICCSPVALVEGAAALGAGPPELAGAWLAVVPPQAATTRLITAIGASHRCLVMLSSAVR
jgi:hypothetical protein